MVGQGRPSTRRDRFALAIVRLLAWLVVLPIPFGAHMLLAAEPTLALRLRIAWGSGAERQWRGTIAVDQGTLALVRPLGIVTDVPGSIWSSSEQQIDIRDRSARAYDGVDVEISAAAQAHLKVTLVGDDDSRGTEVDVPLSELLDKTRRDPLDTHGNQLLIRRSPGDQLRVSFARDSLIFSPGEAWDLDVSPQQLAAEAGTTVHFKSRLLPARGGDEVWSQEKTMKWPGPSEPRPTVTLNLTMPQQEGAYDLVIEASERGPLPLRLTKTLIERHMQMVVVDSQSPASGGSTDWTPLMEIDPTSSHWYDLRRAIPKLPSFIPYVNNIWKGPLVNGHMAAVDFSAGRAMELSATAPGSDPSWVAYPLSARPGLPHMLEVEYPADARQTLGISIIEPNAAGMVMPYGLDSGVYSDEPLPSESGWARHRLIFWPRTSSPLLLLVNRGERGARFGKIRLSSASRLPRTYSASEPTPERLLAGYFHRPRFTANFGASESLDPVSGRSLTDWQTFFEGSTRLAEYLNYVGYNGTMLNVFSEGSTIYPSKLLDSTPRFDTGMFFDGGQDPMRKDVLELVLRLFDRERLKLIPAMEFATPLPELEAILRAGGQSADGIQLIGPKGLAYTDVEPLHHGLAPYYNPLDPRVQQAVISVVHELVARYGRHPSFAGLAIVLSAHGYTQLPGDLWGLDDQTIHRFERDTQTDTGAGDGPDRFVRRAQFVSGPGRAQWRRWRCAELANFHRLISKELIARGPSARLYLAPTDMLDVPMQEQDEVLHLRPSLPPGGNADEAMEYVGINPRLYYNDPQIVLLRPQQIQPPGLLTAQGVDIELNRSADWDRLIAAGPSPGSLQFQELQRLRLESFDAKSTLGRDKTYTALSSQFSPSGQMNRQRFVHSLATLDSQSLFDGGWWLPLGQEESLADFVAAYRRLPAIPFGRVADCPQPLTVRTAETPSGTLAYLVNDSRWKIKAQIQTNAPSGSIPAELGGRHSRNLAGPTWTVELAPYDLAVFQFNARNVQFFSPQVDMGEAHDALAAAIDDLKQRLAAAPRSTPLADSGFELPAIGNQIPGWSVAGHGTATLDSTNPHGGRQSLRLSSVGGLVTLRSDPFPVPKTGRVAMSFFVRVDDPSEQPSVRIVVEGLPASRKYFPNNLIGAGTTTPIGSQWHQILFPIDTDGLTELRFRLDVAGQTSLYVDDVEMNQLFFSEPELLYLKNIFAQMEFALRGNQLGDCQYELEDYWPRFLKANAPLTSPVAETPRPPASPPPEKAASKPGVVDRVKGLFKL